MNWGLVFNILIRLSILYFLGEVLLFPDDPRFAGKAIPIRNFIIVITLSLLFPVLYFLKTSFPRRRESNSDHTSFNWIPAFAGMTWKNYPFWWDNLYLSIFWLDMFGNSFNLYDSYFYFDLIPHFHSTAAVAAVFLGAFGLSFWGGVGLANIIHMLLEAQEYYTDVFLGTHNVRGTFDVVNDLMVGVVGTILYGMIYLYRFSGPKSGMTKE